MSRSAYLKGSWITGIFLCNGNRVLYSRSLIFPVIGKTVSDLFEGPDKKSRDPLLEVCIGLFSGCCVSLLEVGRDNTVE